MAAQKDQKQWFEVIKTVSVLMAVLGLVYGIISTHVADKIHGEQNSSLIKRNSDNINILKQEFKSQKEKQTELLHQIFIKVTRLEARAEQRTSKSY
jgi:K+-transporting ATPase c subunit